MPRLVRAMAAFGVVLVLSLSISCREVRAQTGTCTIERVERPGTSPPSDIRVRAGEKIDLVAVCNGIDLKTTEFYWTIVPEGGKEIKLGGGAGQNLLLHSVYPKPGNYEIKLVYGTAQGIQPMKTATIPVIAAPAAPAPPPVAATKPPARPPARVAMLDQVAFTPTSLTLPTNKRGSVTATKPTIGDPHIRWTLGRGTVTDKWTVSFGPIAKPGDYKLDAVVWNGNNMSENKSYEIPIKVIGDTLNVRLQGHTKLQLNEGGGKVPVIVTPQNGVPPYRLTVSVAGGASGSRNFDRQTQFNISTTTPGSKTITIAVVDAKGSTFNRTIPFSIAAAGAPPPTSANPFEGSYEGIVTGPNPPNRYKYWAHVPNYDPDGTVHVSLYAFGDNYHVALKGGSLTVDAGISGFKTSGTGSISGNGAVGTTITMRWMQTGSDGKPTPYTWVLKKYDDRDLGGPQPGYAR